jgi:cysteine-rich repeat protein
MTKQSPALPRAVTWRRLRQASIGGVVIAFAAAACTDDAIVYPNRGLAAQGGEAGAMAAAGESGSESGAASSLGGTGGTGGSIVVGDEAGAAGTGPRCGDGIVQPPEECDDGNTFSGDGCSALCQSHCETCESKVCSIPQTYDMLSDINPPEYDGCYKAPGIILKGPAATVPRREVCRELIDCIRSQKCAQPYGDTQVKFARCWCDVPFTSATGIPAACASAATFVPGKCASLFQDASEGDTPADVSKAFTRTASALGLALRLLEGCDARICVEECLPEYFGDKTVATITEDLTRAPNSSGESQLGDLTADAQRSVAGTDVALVRSDALCQEDAVGSPSSELAFLATPNRPADADGRVLWSEALATQYCYGGGNFVSQAYNPSAGNSLLKATFTGQQLYDALTIGLGGPAQVGTTVQRSPFFVSGLTYTWQEAAATAFPTIVEIRKDGVSIGRTATFSVALSDFFANSLTIKGSNAAAVADSEPATLFGKYLSQLPQPISPPTLDRVTRLAPTGG